MKGNIRFNKKTIAIALAGAISLGTVGGVIYSFNQEPSDTRVENQTGHYDLIPIPFFDVPGEDFVVFDVGNHTSDGILFQDYKMNYCIEHGISIGVIICPDTNSFDGIYDDVEYVKGLIEDYTISFPVYLNIDTLMNDTGLDLNTITKYASAFLEKCADNGIYVGIYGTDQDLCLFKEYTGISGYDAFVVMDQEEVQYDGSYSIVQDLDGNIQASTNLATVIAQNGNNTMNGFVVDDTRVVEDENDFRAIALASGMSEDELLAFNNKSRDDVVSGLELRIPTSVSDMQANDFVRVEDAIRGADLSYAQGTDIDWEELRDNFSYLILKCNEGTLLDETFENNTVMASNYGIPIGVYCYNAYDMTNTVSMDDFLDKQKEQVDTLLSALDGKEISYPVYLDVELPSGASWEERYNSEYVSNMLNYWVERVEQAGYTPGLYCNQSGLEYLQGSVNYNLADRLELWVAGGEQYTVEKEDIPLEEVRPSSLLESNPDISMVQVTDSAVGAGAGNGDGHLDINYSSKDYSIPALDDQNELLCTKDFDHLPIREAGIGVGSTGVLVGIGIAGVKIKKLVNRRK